MSTNRCGCAGIGIRLTEELKQIIFKDKYIAKDWSEGDLYDHVEELKIPFDTYESEKYESQFCFLVPGKTLNEILANMEDFFKHFYRFGIQLRQEDLEFINE